MSTFRQKNAAHCFTDQDNIGFFSVHIGGPVAILGDRGIEHTVPVAIDCAGDLCILEACQLQRGGGEPIVTLTEQLLV